MDTKQILAECSGFSDECLAPVKVGTVKALCKQINRLEADFNDAACRRCSGAMLPSKAIAQTYGGSPDFAGGPVVTMSPEGPGRLIDCLKCKRCGHSITPNV